MGLVRRDGGIQKCAWFREHVEYTSVPGSESTWNTQVCVVEGARGSYKSVSFRAEVEYIFDTATLRTGCIKAGDRKSVV